LGWYTNVPQRYKEDPKLGSWVDTQRQSWKRGKIPDHRISKLDSIEFVWEPVKSGVATDPKWNARFEKLKVYKETHGHCRVSATTDKTLQGWVIEQRVQFNRGGIKESRKEKLDSLGFQWEIYDELFAGHLKRLEQYRDIHGDCLVPSDDPELGSWVHRIRTLCKEGRLPEERQQKLEELGFVWCAGMSKEDAELQWREQYMNLKSYKEDQGDCVVPTKYNEDPQLGCWVGTQRSHFNRGTLRQDRKALLDKIGFDWDPKQNALYDAQWEIQYKNLKKIHEELGHCLAPLGTPLNFWVQSQRIRRYNTTNNGRRPLSQEEIDRLDEIGFLWKPRDGDKNWKQMYKRLKKYKLSHGDCLVPMRFQEDGALGNWVSTQRMLKKRDEIPQDRQEKLENLGFVWIVRDYVEQDQTRHDEKWKIQYEKLCLFRDENGHTLVPKTSNLCAWVARQRYIFKKNELKSDRRDLLEEIDFVWSVDHYDTEKSLRAKHWEGMYEELVVFKTNEGHCKVPHNHNNGGLARWVQKQRNLLPSNRLHADRRAKLDDIDFFWSSNDN